MKKRFEIRTTTSDADLKKRGTIVQVPTVRLDDFIAGRGSSLSTKSRHTRI